MCTEYRTAVMKEALAKTKVPGRMEHFVSRDKKICGVVDFAHNRLSFEKLFSAVLLEYEKYGKIITVFGCPGRESFEPRRELGIIAGLFSRPGHHNLRVIRGWSARKISPGR